MIGAAAKKGGWPETGGWIDLSDDAPPTAVTPTAAATATAPTAPMAATTGTTPAPAIRAAPVPSLTSMLDAAMQQSNLRIGVNTAMHGQMRSLMAKEPALAAEARQMLAGIDPGALQRDHISQWLQATLEGALPKE